jgi:hypothetical protein
MKRKSQQKKKLKEVNQKVRRREARKFALLLLLWRQGNGHLRERRELSVFRVSLEALW